MNDEGQQGAFQLATGLNVPCQNGSEGEFSAKTTGAMTRSHNSRRGKSASLKGTVKGTVEKGPHRQKAIKEHNHRRNRAERRGVLAQDPRDLLMLREARWHNY
jgi:hypothetical protein